jgi:hypothetical protein
MSKRASTPGWTTHCRPYVDRVCAAEYEQQKRASKGRKSFRYSPSDYARQLIEYMDQDDEEGFKSLKMLQGYSSAVGV